VNCEYSSPSLTGSTSTLSCAVSTHHPAALALHQPHCAPRLLVSRPHKLYNSYVVRRDYSPLDRSGSTSTMPCDRVHRAAHHRLLHLCRATRCLGSSRSSSSTISPVPCVLHLLDLDYSLSGCTSSTSPMSCIRTCRLAVISRRSVALALAMRPVTPSRGSTTPCVATRLVVRSH
jgi:hypothetical protein